MPNHVTTVCTITGPQDVLARFVELHIVAGEDGPRFAFETIIPKPAILDKTEAGSEATIGMMALVGDVVHTDFARYGWIPREVLAGAPFYHARQVRAWLEKERPAALEKGRIGLQAIVETGYPDWYQWSKTNWGTKWGAYDFDERERVDGRYVFKFETAWAFPEPIFRRLAELYPALIFAVVAFDEGWNFAAEGEFNGRNNYREGKELVTDELHMRVYGRKMRDEDGEDSEEVAP